MSRLKRDREFTEDDLQTPDQKRAREAMRLGASRYQQFVDLDRANANAMARAMTASDPATLRREEEREREKRYEKNKIVSLLGLDTKSAEELRQLYSVLLGLGFTPREPSLNF
ncbi:MAG: hypothetical protein CL967_05595 [Euryarchaeota archaeon]|nr:hypothetical protein [Euryarchaeota archaeon]